MLSKLPKHTGDFAQILDGLGNPPADRIARALGVSRRTVHRWKTSGAPRTALLALWWLSREGHSFWDCEMHERTRLALEMNAALWRKVREYSLEDTGHLWAFTQVRPALTESGLREG